jgi:quercetin dioxygenase-like cupin family protein
VTLRTRVSNADTAAACVLLDVTLPPFWDGCALHWHARTTEVMYVLNGTLAYTLDDITTTASDGTVLLILPGVVHTIWNPTATPTTYLAWFAPGSAERPGGASTIRAASAPAHLPTPCPMLATLSAADEVLLTHPDANDSHQPR